MSRAKKRRLWGGGQALGLGVAGLEQVVQVGSGIAAAEDAGTVCVHRPPVADVAVVQGVVEVIKAAPPQAFRRLAVRIEHVQPLMPGFPVGITQSNRLYPMSTQATISSGRPNPMAYRGRSGGMAWQAQLRISGRKLPWLSSGQPPNP